MDRKGAHPFSSPHFERFRYGFLSTMPVRNPFRKIFRLQGIALSAPVMARFYFSPAFAPPPTPVAFHPAIQA